MLSQLLFIPLLFINEDQYVEMIHIFLNSYYRHAVFSIYITYHKPQLFSCRKDWCHPHGRLPSNQIIQLLGQECIQQIDQSLIPIQLRIFNRAFLLIPGWRLVLMPKAVGPQKVFGVRGTLMLDKFEMSNRFNLLWIVGWFWLGTDPGSNPLDQGPFDMQNTARCTLYTAHCTLNWLVA